MILNILLNAVAPITFCLTNFNVKFRVMICNYMLFVLIVYFWRNVNNNSPAFELLQLTVVQHTSHVLIHLLQTHIENKAFLLGIHNCVNFLRVCLLKKILLF